MLVLFTSQIPIEPEMGVTIESNMSSNYCCKQVVNVI